MADLSWLGAAGRPQPTSDLPPVRPCWDTGPDGHAPHYWHTAGQCYFCPGLRHREAKSRMQAQPPRSCHRRANHEPHPAHGWHPDGLDAPPAWCAGVRSVNDPAEQRLCYTSTPHPAHPWAGAPPYDECDPQEAPFNVEYRCPGIPVTSTFGDPQPLAAAFREVPEGERVTASSRWQGASNPLDDLVAYQAAGYPGLSAPREREVAPVAHLVERIRAFMARRPLVLVHDQATADALAGASAELPGLGIALVVDEAIPAGTALVVDRAKLAETLGRWAAEQAAELRPQLPLRLAAFPPATVAEPGTIGWAALVTGL